MPIVFSYRALTVSGAPFQGTSPDFVIQILWVLQPQSHKETV